MTKYRLLFICGLLAASLLVGCAEGDTSSDITSEITIGDISGNTVSAVSSIPSDLVQSSGQTSDETSDSSVSKQSTAASQNTDSKASTSISSSKATSSGSVQTEEWNLILVNKNNKLPSDYAPTLAAVPNGQLDKRIAQYMKDMLAAAEDDNVPLAIVSSYRTLERQAEKFNARVKELMATGLTKAEAETEAGKYIAPPGTSEHCTGLAADIVSPNWYSTHSSLTADFDQTKQFTWLSKNAAKYGFILRYPKDKTDITMISYEPWHYRYVGVEVATEITSKGFTLEEYLGQ